MSTSVQSLLDYGNNGLVVDIECNLSNNLPNIVIVGFANKAVDEARERVRGAFSSSGLDIPRKRITINLAPADIPKASSSFDLAIAAAIMMAAGAKKPVAKQAAIQPDAVIRTDKSAIMYKSFTKHEAVIGELGLDGGVRPVRGIIGKILAGRRRGITAFYIPAANLAQAVMVPGVTVCPVSNLKQLHDYLFTDIGLPAQETGSGTLPAVTDGRQARGGTAKEEKMQPLHLSDIVGQQQAKRALMIAAAGGHNLLLSGPPGTGKSMLARALPSILPRLTVEEMLEVTHLHSLSGSEYDRIINARPFRSPHHSASHVSIVGGGGVLRPGEISLAHRGVLFFDELPEFNRSTIEALRQPLEDRSITIARANDRLEFPANFILIATANPCPCGYYGVPQHSAATRRCECAPGAIQRYQSKLSGPILDRIDLFSEVHEVDHGSLLQDKSAAAADSDQDVSNRIAAARRLQYDRFGGASLNSDMTNRDLISHAKLSPEAKRLLDMAGGSLDLSARAYMRSVKVGRTIADLSQSEAIEHTHITEALQYRNRSSQTAASAPAVR